MEGACQLSIIIPVYNLEYYIRHCLDTVVGYEDLSIEIILIDDGSTDGSPSICEEYATRYSQVRVIHKLNEGASVARNTGMQMARGTYLMFIDGDDFLEKDILRAILNELDGETQLYTYHFYDYYQRDHSKNSVKHLELHDLYDREGNITREVFYSVPALPMPWLYIIKREYVFQHALFMKAGILDEDEEWSARVFANLRTFKNLDIYVYNYRRNRLASLTNGRSYQNLLADLTIIKLLREEASLAEYDRRQRNILHNKCRELLKRTIKESVFLEQLKHKEVSKQQRGLRKLLLGGSRADIVTYLLSLIIGLEKAMKMVQWIAYLKTGGHN